MIMPHPVEAGFREIMLRSGRDLSAWPYAWPVPMQDVDIMIMVREVLGAPGRRWIRVAGWLLFASREDAFWYRIIVG
jgi:hypothetical protein